jgi:hypothetical protein
MSESMEQLSTPDTGHKNGNGEAPLTPTEIQDHLLRVGEIEDEASNKNVLPAEEARGAEHLRAAEGIMTFQTLRDVDQDDWMDKQLDSIAKKHRTGPSRPRRSGIARRVFGA